MSVTFETIAISIEDILTTLKSLETPELFKLLKTALTEAEKKSKTTTKTATKAAATKRQSSMPKGTVPPQLKKPRAWVEFTLKHALENGWESFTVTQKKKDSSARGSGGQDVSLEVIEMPASTLHEGAHIYEDSISEKNPNGKQIIHKEAMSLSKFRKESGHPTYAEFEAQYAEEIASEEPADDSDSTTSSKQSKASTVVKKTAAEKAAEMEAKKAAKAEEKAAKEQAKAEEKERKKAEKEQAKAEEKERKEAEKAQAKAEAKAAKEQAKAEVKGASKVVPAKEVKQSSPAGDASLVSTEKPVEKSVEPVKATKTTQKKEEVKTSTNQGVKGEACVPIPDDGMVHPWTFEGKKYLRNADGETWSVGADGGIGKWVGVYSSKTNKIDTTATEPEFDDEE